MIIITDNTSEAGNVFPAIINLQSKNITQRLPKDDLEKKLFINEELYEIDYRQNNSFDFLYLAKHSQNSQFDVLHKIINSNSKIPNKMACLAITGEKFHGFRNRAWTAEKGNIHLTIHFKPKQTFENLHVGLLVLAAVSILETIDTIPDLRGGAKTKWVNDIVIDNKKVAGIITQSFSQGNKVTGALIGIGLNVEVIPLINKDIFTPEASCLKHFSNSENCNLKKVFTQLLARLSANIDLLNSADYYSLLNKYKKRSAVIGKNAEVYSDPIEGIPSLIIKGKVKDINERLELIFENSEEKINKGRLSLIE